MLVYGLTLNQDVFELYFVLISELLKNKEGWVPRIFFFWKNNLFRLFSRIWIKRHFQVENPISYFH